MALERMMAKLSTHRYAARACASGAGAEEDIGPLGDPFRVSVDLLTDGIMIGTGDRLVPRVRPRPRSGPCRHPSSVPTCGVHESGDRHLDTSGA